MIEHGADRTYLTIGDQNTSKTILYSDLINRLSIYTSNHYNEWEYPKMITGIWQWIELDINLNFDGVSLKSKMIENAQKVEIILFSRDFTSNQIEPFQNFITRSISSKLSECTTKIHFTSKFQIPKTFSSLRLKKFFLIGLKIGPLSITYLTKDILVGSNQVQINPPYKFGEKLKTEIRKNTYWFQQAENNIPKSKKRDKSDTDDAVTDEKDTKKIAFEHLPLAPTDSLLVELFPDLLTEKGTNNEFYP